MDGEILQRIYMRTVSETIYHQIGLLSQNVVYIWMSGVYYLIILDFCLFYHFMFTIIGLILFGHFFVYNYHDKETCKISAQLIDYVSRNSKN